MPKKLQQSLLATTGKGFDFIIISGESYDDHPLSPTAVIARVLVAEGFRVGIIERPESAEDFLRLGTPRLSFCVTSGSFDSMLNNYTALKRKRSDDTQSSATTLPDRAVIFYCNKIREIHKNSTIIIGGVEASLRRFAHYDYWQNKVRRSILFDSRADLLVYGNGEKQMITLAHRLDKQESLQGVAGTCIILKKNDPDQSLLDGFEQLPSFEAVSGSKKEFCRLQRGFSNSKNLAQQSGSSYLLQYAYPVYTAKDLDAVYSLPFSRKLAKNSPLKMAQFSVVTHRGCLGKCNFCSLSLHQGSRIISRTEASILAEISHLAKHADFKGYIDDLGGPSANMYGMDCSKDCEKSCCHCPVITNPNSHRKLVQLLRKARKIKGIKKVFVRSGIRYDLAITNDTYLKELSEHHISGCLKIAPEHLSEKVLTLMQKDNKSFRAFVSRFTGLNKPLKQQLRYYFLLGHPGETLKTAHELAKATASLKNMEQCQIFTPTPMTISSCMYWTETNPFTGEKIAVIKDFQTKKQIKKIMFDQRRSPTLARDNCSTGQAKKGQRFSGKRHR